MQSIQGLSKLSLPQLDCSVTINLLYGPKIPKWNIFNQNNFLSLNFLFKLKLSSTPSPTTPLFSPFTPTPERRFQNVHWCYKYKFYLWSFTGSFLLQVFPFVWQSVRFLNQGQIFKFLCRTPTWHHRNTRCLYSVPRVGRSTPNPQPSHPRLNAGGCSVPPTAGVQTHTPSSR